MCFDIENDTYFIYIFFIFRSTTHKNIDPTTFKNVGTKQQMIIWLLFPIKTVLCGEFQTKLEQV